MEFKDLIDRNWSRKAELVIVTIAGIAYVSQQEGIEEGIAELAIWTMAAVGSLGIVAQAVIDWKSPKDKTDSAVAADEITTILNSYGMSAERAGEVSDDLFTKVKRGKTTTGAPQVRIDQIESAGFPAQPVEGAQE